MIKVLHFGISAHLGGIETYSYKIARNFDMTRFHFDFLYLGKEYPCFYKEIKEQGCGFIGITSRKKNYIKYLMQLEGLFRNGEWDIVHLHFNSLDRLEPLVFALKYGYKVVVHSRNGGMPLGTLKSLIHRLNFFILRKIKVKKVAVSDLAGNWMFGEDAAFQIINNGIDLSKAWYSQEGREKVRKEFYLGDSPLIVHIGSFKAQKNHQFLVDVFNEIYKRRPEYKLMLVGTGELLETIKKQVYCYGLNENVIFTESRNDVVDILSAADYFLFPSFYEGFPNALIEAETSGLKCLVADTITDNVIFQGTCKKLSLHSAPALWAEELLKLDKTENRLSAIIEAECLGLDVGAEIATLEELYLDMMTN